MPRRIPLTNEEYYHITSRSIANERAFPSIDYLDRALEIINYYCHSGIPVRYSYFQRMTPKAQADLLTLLKKNRVEIVSFCLMPTHYHFVMKQAGNEGIKNFIHDFQDSYVKYFNKINSRHGALFQASFKAIRITSEEQFMHTCRYIHLNPYSSGLVKNKENLLKYKWSSLYHYLGNNAFNFIAEDASRKMFSNKKLFLEFTLDHADYQKTLELLKYHTPGV